MVADNGCSIVNHSIFNLRGRVRGTKRPYALAYLEPWVEKKQEAEASRQVNALNCSFSRSSCLSG